jgi:hypothetical protein
MHRFVFALTGALLASTAYAQQSFVGTYKAVSLTVDYKGRPSEEPQGKTPRGYLVVTPKLWLVFTTSEQRKPGRTAEEKAALIDSMGAYSGSYRVEGNKITISIDAAWNEVWRGTQQVRLLELKGKRLIFSSPPIPSARFPGETVVIRSEWERIE